jgi:hypothetical protein
MFAISVGWRRYGPLVLAGCLMVGGTAVSARADGESLRGNTRKVDDLKVTPLRLRTKSLLPCMVWADARGTAFLTLEGDTGLLRRVSFPDCKIVKEADLDRKFSWMAMSAEGLVLTQPDAKVWVVDPVTLEVKGKIEVPKLKRATSAPAVSWAVASDEAPHQTQMLYIVDLKKKTAEPWDVPRALRSTIGLENPAMSPDGAYVFTHGNNMGGDSMALTRFSFGNGSLQYEDMGPRMDMRFHIGPNTTDNTAGFTFSPHSKWLCLVKPWGGTKRNETAVYSVESFDKVHCTIDHADGQPRGPLGEPPLAVGFDLKGGYLYTQNNDWQLMVCSLHGIMRKEYTFDNGANRPVIQFLVYPGGNQAVALTRETAWLIELPRKERPDSEETRPPKGIPTDKK